MLKALTIKNFKCFESLQVDGLKRVNLIVGLNNSGKSCLIEAIHFLAAENPVESLHVALGSRDLKHPSESEEDDTIFDIRHLFFGRVISLGSLTEVQGLFRKDHDLTDSPGDAVWAKFSIVDPDSVSSEDLYSLIKSAAAKIARAKACAIFESSGGHHVFAGLTRAGGVDESDLKPLFEEPGETDRVRHIPTFEVDVDTVADWWRGMRHSELDDAVLGALHTMAGEVRKVDFPPLPKSRSGYLKSDVRVYRVGEEGSPVPLSSMGDGMWRMLGLALGMTGVELRYTLIDEIDTGLHYTVLPDMWRMVARTAAVRDVQVFATTHSYDCLRGLAEAAYAEPSLADQIAIIHLSPSRETATAYSIEEWESLDAMGGDVRGGRVSRPGTGQAPKAAPRKGTSKRRASAK